MKKTILFYTFLALVVFSSCDKDGSGKEDFDKDWWEDKDKGDWGKEKCFELVYPIIFTMPDGSSLSVNDEKNSAINDWYKTNDSKEKPQLQYPVDIVFKDDNDEALTKTINNEDEMIVAKKKCKDDDWDKKECFYLVYPITFIMPDASSITLNDDKNSTVKDWYNANPDVKEKPELQYPVDIVFEDATTRTINNEDEMIVAKKECED